MDLILVPINEHLEQNEKLLANPHCVESLGMICEFYKRVSFYPPWTGYYARRGDELLGCAAFVGRPIDGTVEIAYATFKKYQRRGRRRCHLQNPRRSDFKNRYQPTGDRPYPSTCH
jgi:[ribosomal protein S5]-alanine N-acetyltransferase